MDTLGWWWWLGGPGMSGILCQTGLTDLQVGNTEQRGIPRRRRAPLETSSPPSSHPA